MRLALLTSAVLTLATCHCCAAAQAEAEWTIMVYLNADNNLEADGIEDFLEMASVGSTKDVNIVVQFDRAKGRDNRYGDWTQTLRFRVAKGMEPSRQNALEDIGEADMADGKTLAAFVEWAQSRYPAKHYMLDVWGHGKGWRMAQAVPLQATGEVLRRILDYKSKLINRYVLPPSKWKSEDRSISALNRELDRIGWPALDQAVDGSLRSVSSDETSGPHARLFNRDLQDALQGVLKGRKLDVIGFDACLMAMVETAYAVRNVGRVMVASEEEEPGSGWDYGSWLQNVASHPDMNAQALGKELVQSYANRYDKDPDVTLSAVDLGAMDALASTVSALSDRLMAKIVPRLQDVKKARSACVPYRPGDLHGIDLGHFCDQLLKSTQDTELQNAAREVRKVLDKMVIANHAGKGRVGDPFGSTGLAIYFPASGLLYENDPDGKGYDDHNKEFPLEFVQTQRWDDFLRSYFRLVLHEEP